MGRPLRGLRQHRATHAETLPRPLPRGNCLPGARPSHHHRSRLLSPESAELPMLRLQHDHLRHPAGAHAHRALPRPLHSLRTQRRRAPSPLWRRRRRGNTVHAQKQPRGGRRGLARHLQRSAGRHSGARTTTLWQRRQQPQPSAKRPGHPTATMGSAAHAKRDEQPDIACTLLRTTAGTSRARSDDITLREPANPPCGANLPMPAAACALRHPRATAGGAQGDETRQAPHACIGDSGTRSRNAGA